MLTVRLVEELLTEMKWTCAICQSRSVLTFPLLPAPLLVHAPAATHMFKPQT